VSVIRQLEAEMREASAALEFERAALLRDQIKELKNLSGGAPALAAAAAKTPKRKKVSYRSR